MADGMPFSAVLAFSITVLFLLALRPVAAASQLIDIPGGRKSHIGKVPVIGGLAMFAGLTFALPFLWPGQQSVAGFLYLAALLLVVIGCIDDRFDLPAAVRLIGQACAALIAMYGAGIVVMDIGDPLFAGVINLGPFSLVFTLLVIVTVINAFNMLDGMDGLAGSVSLIALLGCLLVGFDTAWQSLILALCAAIVAFLLFNFPMKRNRRVRTFMGDAGSTMLGFSVAVVVIGLSQGEGRTMSPVVGLWFAALPLFDLFGSMIRRVLKGQSPFRPDSEHIHHILQRAGLSSRGCLAVLAGASAIGVAIGYGGHVLGVSDGVLFGLWVILGGLHFWVMRRAWRISRFIRRTQAISRG
ncbi:hypothetical protein [Lentisalinibacter sediminis]|uniref:hypothetical protein n=1 Tax=Lentisalinibacter sediminis TaxID=2992237 RepID=UPI00386CC692